MAFFTPDLPCTKLEQGLLFVPGSKRLLAVAAAVLRNKVIVSRGENRMVSELQVRLTRRKAASFTLRLRLSVLGAQTA
jgi:hypothetical protein